MARELKKTETPFVLIGGFAVNAYGFSRATADIDFLMAGNDYEKALDTLKSSGFKELQHQHL